MFKPFTIEPIQKVFYLAWKSRPYSAEHSHLLAYRLSSKPNIESLKQAIYAFVNRYPLSLSVVDPATEQFVYKAFSISDYFFINTGDCGQASSEIESIRHQPFDCENQPFIRFYLFKAQGEWHFVFSAHHICCDARSASILIDELAMLYARQVAPEVAAHQQAYFDAIALCEHLRKQQESSSRQYWCDAFSQLKNQDAGIRQISTAQDESHRAKDIVFDTRVLTPIYKTYHTTGFGFFSAAIGVLLAQYTQTQSCIIQTPVDIRPQQFLHTIGCFINVVPLFVHLPIKDNFSELIKSLNQQRKGAKSYLRFASQQIDQLNPWNHCVQFGMANTLIKSSEFQFGQIRAMPLDHRFSVSHHYDFFALLEITSSETRLRIEAKPDFMQAQQLEIFCHSLESWIHQMIHCDKSSMPLWLDASLKYQVDKKPCVSNNQLNTSKDLSVFEKKLSVLWRQIAANPELSVNDDLTMAGIDSIKAISLIAKINESFNHSFTVADLYQHQTIRQFALFLCQFSSSTDIKPLSKVQSKNDHLPQWYFVHPGKGGVSIYQPIANALSRDYQIIGIENHNLFNRNKIKGLSNLSNNYLNQIVSSGYPLNNEITLCGWSLGGLIALEMAAQLEVLGLENIKVALFDTYVMDCSLQEMRKKIDEEQYKKLYQHSLDTLNIDPEFYKALMHNLDGEIQLETESPSRKLTRTKVTLFKAEQIDQSLHDPYLIKYNQHIVDLPLNNVDEYVEKQNIQRVRLACHHGQILSMLSFLAGFNILQAYMNHDVKY